GGRGREAGQRYHEPPAWLPGSARLGCDERQRGGEPTNLYFLGPGQSTSRWEFNGWELIGERILARRRVAGSKRSARLVQYVPETIHGTCRRNEHIQRPSPEAECSHEGRHRCHAQPESRPAPWRSAGIRMIPALLRRGEQRTSN